MTDLLRLLLIVRDALTEVAKKASAYGYEDEVPEVKQMQDLERKLLEKVNEWDKP